MTTVTWIVIAVLGAASVFLLVRKPPFGLLGMAMTLFLAAAQLASLPGIAIWLFLGIWFIFLALVAVKEIRTARQMVGITLPPFSAGILTIMLGMVIGGAGAAAGQMMALPLPGGGIQNVAVVADLPADSVEPVDAEQECPTGTYYYAYDAEPDTNAMGSAITVDTVEAGAYRFNVKKECDPLWLATTVHAIKYGENLDQGAVQAEAQSYLDDPTARDAAKQFVDSQVVKFYLVDAGNVPYDSLGMIPGADENAMPTLTKFSRQPALGQDLVAELEDGSKRHFRVTCDLQFSIPTEFKKVVPHKERTPKIPPTTYTTPPPSTETTPSTSTTTTTTPSTETTTTTTPETSTTTTTPDTSTTTTTTETTTTTTETTETTTTTTTTPPSSTTTTNTKTDVTVPDGLPTDTTQGELETTAPVESNPQGTVEVPNDEATDVPDDEATQQPTTEPSTPQPGAPTDGTGIGDPDGSSNAAGMVALLSLGSLLGGVGYQNRKRSKATQ